MGTVRFPRLAFSKRSACPPGSHFAVAHEQGSQRFPHLCFGKVELPPSIDRPAVQSNARLCPPPELLACSVQVTVAAMRAKVRWIASATLGQRQLDINFHRHLGALHAKSAGRRRLSPRSAIPHSGQLGRAIPGGLHPHAKPLSRASVERRRNCASRKDCRQRFINM
jgi:hypothetical protein